MFRRCFVGCAVALALVAGTFAVASPPSRAISIKGVSMQSQASNWSKVSNVPPGSANLKVILGGTRIVDSKVADYRQGDVVTHLNTQTMKANLPQVLPARVYNPQVQQ
jgi:hypothetical protein